MTSSDAPINFTREVAWVDSSCCQSCGATSWIPWKHHCRACGGCFCQNCSSKSLALPPKHPTPVRVCDKCYNLYTGPSGRQPKPKGVGSAPPMSASLPVDFFNRKIDDYSGPIASPIDPMAASVRDFDLGESPKAKWLTDRPASYYYSAPPASPPSVETPEEEEEEKPEEKEEKVVPLLQSSTEHVSSEVEVEKKEEEEKKTDDEPKPENDEPAVEEQSGKNVAREAEAAKETTEQAAAEEEKEVEVSHQGPAEGEPSDGGQQLRGHHDRTVDEEPKVSNGANGESDENVREEGKGEGERGGVEAENEHNKEEEEEAEEGGEATEAGPTAEVAPPQEGEGEERPSGPSGGSYPGADEPVVDERVHSNAKPAGEEETTTEGGERVPTTDEPKLSTRGAADEKEVMELKEIIKRTEEEDRAEKEKMQAIQNKLKNMHDNSLRERLELGSLAAKELSSSIFYGLRDALRVKHATISVQKSNRVYNHIIDTIILNGPLLLVMYIVFKYVFEPHFHSMLSWKEHRGFTLVFVQIVEFLLKAAFLVLWVGPIYVLSVVLNMQWSQEVGNGAFSLYLYIRRGKTVQKASKPLSDTIAQIIYWQIIFGVFNLLNFLCKFIPIVGPPFYFVCLCWLNAVYCFDYKWGNQKWSLHKKISYCETRWLYFIGFGLPITLATFFFEYIISYSLVSLLFPLFIPMAMYGSPKTQSLWKPIPMSRFLDSSIIAPLIRFIFTVPSQVEKLEQKVDTIVRFLALSVCSMIGLVVVSYLTLYLVG